MGRKGYIIIAAILVVILAIGGTVYFTTSNNYAAKVGGEKITKAEYQFFLSTVKQQLASMGITDMKQKVQNKTAEELAREGALESATEYKIQLIKAKENNVKLTSEELKSLKSGFESNVIQQSGGSKLEADKKIREELGISIEQYEEIYKNYYLTQKFAQEEAKKIKLSDEDVKNFYYDTKNFDQTAAWHILVKTVDDENKALPEDKIKEAEKKANEILEKVKAGEDFAALAKQYSEDPGSKDTGGEYIFPKGQMMKEFEDWAFNSKEGDTGIVKTTYGYHVMKKPTYAEIKNKDTIKNTILSKKYSEQMEKWKKDPNYKPVKNDKVINSIKV